MFSPLLDLIPTYLQDSFIPVASALMGLVAVCVQWFSEEGLSVAGRRILFWCSLAVAFAAALLFYTVSTFVVETVDFGGQSHRETASFLIGFTRPTNEPCGPKVSDANCIKVLSFDRSRIADFWGDRNIRLAT
jgi:hypothetical protein